MYFQKKERLSLSQQEPASYSLHIHLSRGLLFIMETILTILTKPNANLHCYQRQSTFTEHSRWDPIENITPWSDFTYQNLIHR